MLGAIRRVTISATNLDVIERAYSEYLEYQVSERGEVSAAEAQAWGCPAAAGAASLSMRPAAGDDFALGELFGNPGEFIVGDPIE